MHSNSWTGIQTGPEQSVPKILAKLNMVAGRRRGRLLPLKFLDFEAMIVRRSLNGHSSGEPFLVAAIFCTYFVYIY
ncbi:hypothetical protein MPL3356_110290 [Mesorhizobium plurifarium]|uniref:Uncharacterized protein n=1 Tax=Mesorhizobium plurifarium TaxID=69974 RepID=A0A090DFV8_MESPL|nr:hypothetical protein MPL3356_110290 [Mesorhizobium plurifarium]